MTGLQMIQWERNRVRIQTQSCMTLQSELPDRMPGKMEEFNMTLCLTQNDPRWWLSLAAYHTCAGGSHATGPCGSVSPPFNGWPCSSPFISLSLILLFQKTGNRRLSSPIHKDAVRIKYRLRLILFRTHDD